MSLTSNQDEQTSSNRIDNSGIKANQLLHNKLSIEDLNESDKNNMSCENTNKNILHMTKDNPSHSHSQSNTRYQYQYQIQSQSQENKDIADINSQIDRLNSNAITTYVYSLNKMIHNLTIENEELKINFVQVSEMLQSERETHQSALTKQQSQSQSEIKLLQTNNEILQKEKQRHLEQNSIEKEQHEVQVANFKKENDQLASRIKLLKEENELLRKDNFDANMRLMETNKMRYENESLKEVIKEMKKSYMGKTSNMTKDNDEKEYRRNKSNDRSNINSHNQSHCNQDKLIKSKVKKKRDNAVNSNSTKLFGNIPTNDNSLNNQNEKQKEKQIMNQSSIVNINIEQKANETPINNAKNKKNKYQMVPYEKVSTKQTKHQSFQIIKEDSDTNQNYNENLKLLQKAYNDYVVRLNSKAFGSIEEEEDLKQKMRMIMETIESQKDQGALLHSKQSK